jgi:hypothetical protein
MSSTQDWRSTEALVYSVEWFDATRYDSGHYKVVYSYTVGNERYVGRFDDYGSPEEDYLHRDDTIRIEYDPEHPQHNRYQAAREPRFGLPKWAGWSFRILVGVLVLLILCFGWRK